MTPQNKRNSDNDNNYQDLSELKVTMKYVQGDVAETKADVKELREIITTSTIAMEARLQARIDMIDARTRNTPLVERVVFGLVGLILFAVAGALVSIVVIKGGI